jgi:2-octaprenyl-6-methoxyphenol hydroxylase
VDERVDIVIAGGGPVGRALALGLNGSGFSIALLEARPPGAVIEDARTLAISHGSRLILERLGAWSALERTATPIRHIIISEQGRFGRAELTADAAQVPALGYVVGYAALQRALAQMLESAQSVRFSAGCTVRKISSDAHGAIAIVDCAAGEQHLHARLIAVADGGSELTTAHVVKTRDYRQSALVCDVVSEQSHHNRAFERFTAQGPLALLPSVRGWSLIWTAGHDRAQKLAAMDDAEFCRELQATFGCTVGRFSAPGPRLVFPLMLKYVTRPIAARTLLLGNAAQMLHPVAGQGFNLGLRDAWELARAIAARDAQDPGAADLLKAYFSQRRYDRTATILFTDSLIRLFCKDIPILNAMRAMGLSAFGAIPGAKNFLARRMMFGTHR